VTRDPDDIRTYDLRDFDPPDPDGSLDRAICHALAVMDRDDPTGMKPVRLVVPPGIHELLRAPIRVTRRGWFEIVGQTPGQQL
jgi:hypothetical protein